MVRPTTSGAVDQACSAQMALIRARDTKPELRVRRALHRAGVRYVLHDKRLAGSPDVVCVSRRVAIFVHGCFWHRHGDPSCKLARLPKSRQEFWIPKLETNRARDQRNVAALTATGWAVEVIWECQIKDNAQLAAVVERIVGMRSLRK